MGLWEQQGFIGFKNTRRSHVFLDPTKHVRRPVSKTFHKRRVPRQSDEGSNCDRNILAYK